MNFNTRKLLSVITILFFFSILLSCKTKAKEEVKIEKATTKKLHFIVLNDKKIDILFREKFKESMKDLYTLGDQGALLLCSGNTYYRFDISKNSKRVLCDFEVDYTIIENGTDQLISKFHKRLIGIGLSKKEAKQNAIDKVKF